MSVKCKGCKAVVVNPLKCPDCGITTHYADSCLGRSGHPWHNGRLLNCKSPIMPSIASNSPLSRTSLGAPALPSLGDFRDLIPSEFANFRKEMLTEIRSDINEVQNSVTVLTERVRSIEDRFSSSANMPSDAGPCTDDVMAEMVERERRFVNLIVYGLTEHSSSPAHLAAPKDAEAVRVVLTQIHPSDYDGIRTRRIGRPNGASPRPLCLSLGSAVLVKEVLRNKSSYSGPLKFADDKTPLQRSSLKRLRDNLSELHANGDTNKTIHYVNGVPRIVSTSSMRRSKN